MKKILTLLILAVGMVAYAQPETVNVGTTGDDGTGDPLRTAMQKLNTNDVSAARNTGTNSQNIDDLTESISSLLGFTLEITDDGDSVQLTIEGSAVKWATANATITDNVVPTILSGNIGQKGNAQLFILFSEDMDSDSIPTHTHGVSGISIYNALGDGEVLINGTYLSNDTCILTLDSAIVSGDAVYVDYIKPSSDRFQDLSANNLSSFTNVGITLTLSAASTDYEWWLFNDSYLGTANIPGAGGNLTLEWVNTDGSEYILPGYEGAAAATSGGFATAVRTTATVNFTDDFTMGGWFKSSGTSARYLFGIEDVWWVIGNYSTDGIEVVEKPGTDSHASSTTGLTDFDDEYRHIVIRYDYSEGYLAIFYDGVNVSDDSIVDATSSGTGVIYIMGVSAAAMGYTSADAFRVEDSYYNDTQVQAWYDNPSNGITEDPGDPIYDDSSEVYFDTQFTHALGSEYTQTLQEIDFGDNAFTNCTNNVHIVAFDGDTVLRNEYEEGHCCNCGVDFHPSGQGTGLNARNYPHANHAGYDHFYMSYNIYLTDPFNIGQSVEACAGSCEMKLPGPTALNTNGVTFDHCFIRLKAFNYNGYDGYWRWIGKFAGESASQFPTVRYESDLIPRGQWVNVTIRVSNNTNYSSNFDGILELFIDGVLLGSWSGLRLTSYDGQVFNAVEYSTHMGGSGWALTAPQDQYMYLDDMVWWNYKDGVTWAVPQGETSPAGRTLVFPDEVNFPK